MKKTFDVAAFKNNINKQLARTDVEATNDFKMGLCEALEVVLNNTGNYKGYNHNYWVKEGSIKWLNAGCPENWDIKKVFVYGENGSPYNRFYY